MLGRENICYRISVNFRGDFPNFVYHCVELDSTAAWQRLTL
jgi:hypothetical protein